VSSLFSSRMTGQANKTTQGCTSHKVKVKVQVILRLTVSASLSWNKAPIWVLRTDLCYCMTVGGLSMWAFSLMRGRVCRLPESHSAIISLLTAFTIYILYDMKYIYNIYKASLSPGSVQQFMPMKPSGNFAP
jgi:hypothetical protein